MPSTRGEGGHVVGAVLEPERAPGPDAAAVAPQVEGQHAVALAERRRRCGTR